MYWERKVVRGRGALSIITIPMIAIYVIFHRQVISGVTEGSIQ